MSVGVTGYLRTVGHKSEMLYPDTQCMVYLQCKFMYPRTSLCQAKDLSTFQRPKLHVTGCLVHGFDVVTTVSNHDHPKCSPVMAKLLATLVAKMKQFGAK